MDIIVVGSAGRETGGIAQYVNNQVENLDTMDVSLHDVATPNKTGYLWILSATVLAILDAGQFTRYDRPDIVHVHTSHWLSFIRASFYVLFTKYVWRRPIVLHVHGSSFDTFLQTEVWPLNWYQSFVLNATCHIIVLSRYWEDVLSTHAPRDKITPVPNAVNPDNFEPDLEGSEPHVVFISALVERKGFNEVVDALHQLEDSEVDNYRVTIAGKGPLSYKAHSLARKFEHIEYRGYVSEKEKRSILGDGTIYLLPSYAEGLPIAILEGMAGGNAIISTSVGSIPEVVREQNGIIVEPGDTDALAEALTALIQNPDAVNKMGSHNRQLIEDEFTWDTVINQVEELYMKCLQE